MNSLRRLFPGRQNEILLMAFKKSTSLRPSLDCLYLLPSLLSLYPLILTSLRPSLPLYLLPLFTPVTTLLTPSIGTPMLWASNPRVLQADARATRIVMPLTWFTKNGWNTMFFAAIAAGIDLTGGFYSFALAEKNNLGVLYKDVAIEFKRRVDGPLTLVATENAAVKAACEEAAKSGIRVNVPVTIDGYCDGQEKPVVSAKATLSIKALPSK